MYSENRTKVERPITSRVNSQRPPPSGWGERRQRLRVTDIDAWLYMVSRAFGGATGTKGFGLREMNSKLGQQKEKTPPRCDPPPEFPATVVAGGSVTSLTMATIATKVGGTAQFLPTECRFPAD